MTAIGTSDPVAWAVFGGVSLALAVAVAWAVYGLAMRLPGGWHFGLIAGLVGGIGAVAASAAALPGDHGLHPTLAMFLAVWPMIVGQSTGRRWARERFALRKVKPMDELA
jgi:hypothetical protein